MTFFAPFAMPSPLHASPTSVFWLNVILMGCLQDLQTEFVCDELVLGMLGF